MTTETTAPSEQAAIVLKSILFAFFVLAASTPVLLGLSWVFFKLIQYLAGDL